MSATAAPSVKPPSVFKEKYIPFHQRRPVAVRSLGLFAKMLGHSMGIEVVFDASIKTAATDNVKIYLPVLNDSGTEEDVILLTGLVCHEGAHTAHTDFSLPLGGDKNAPQLLADLHNIVEDIWIEKKQSHSYPGVPSKISEAIRILCKRGTAFLPPKVGEDVHPAATVTGLIISGLRSLYLDQPALKDQFPKWRKEAVKALGDKLVRAIWSSVCKVRDCGNTARALEIAKEVYDLIKDQAEGKDPPEPKDPGIGQPGSNPGAQGQGQQTPGQAGNDPQGQSGGQEDPQGQPQPGQQGQGSGQGQPDPNGKPGKSGKPDPKAPPKPGEAGYEPDPKAKQDAAKSVLNATKKELGKNEFTEHVEKGLEETGAKPAQGRGGYGAGTGRNDVYQRVLDIAGTEAIINRARPIAVRLGNELEVLLESKTDTDIYWTQEGRKLDSARLSRVAVGNFGLFKHKDDREGLNTALSLAADISGSMDNWSGGYGRRSSSVQSPLEVAEVAMYTVLQACDAFDGVKTAAAAFGTSVHPIKDFDESFRSTRSFLWNRDKDGGGTDTHWAANYLGRQLLMREEERKLFMLITDGMPSRVPDTAAALGEILRNGGEVAVLFIANDESVYAPLKQAMQGSGATFAAVSSSEQLLSGIFEAIRNSM